jgi:23S rRNA pseudouridine2605 synthase
MNDELKHPADAPEQEITSEALELNKPEAVGEPRVDPIAEPAESVSRSEDEAPAEDGQPIAKLERLQKILAQAGVASRRHAEELITQGRVQVNGKTVTVLGSKADPARDHIRVDGKLLHGAERRRYFVLNKPKGYVTSVTDPEGRPTVMEFFAKLGERLYPVGRLDYQSEGLLLVTNDGELANQLTKAASGVEKTYLVKVAGRPSEAMLDRLRKGIAIDKEKVGSGKVHTAPARIQQVRPGENPWYEVVLIEGRNRELRKMFEEIGHHVEKIRRVGYGPLALDVEPGKIRELSADEVRALQLTAEGKMKPRSVKATYFLPKEAGLTTEQRAAKARKGHRKERDGAREQRRPADRSRESAEGRSFGGARRFDSRSGRGFGESGREREGTSRHGREPRDDQRPRTGQRFAAGSNRSFGKPGRKVAGNPESIPRERQGSGAKQRPTGSRSGGDFRKSSRDGESRRPAENKSRSGWGRSGERFKPDRRSEGDRSKPEIRTGFKKKAVSSDRLAGAKPGRRGKPAFGSAAKKFGSRGPNRGGRPPAKGGSKPNRGKRSS